MFKIAVKKKNRILDQIGWGVSKQKPKNIIYIFYECSESLHCYVVIGDTSVYRK